MAGTFSPVPLTPEHLEEAAAVLGRAVPDDPLFTYVFPEEQQRTSGVPPMMAMFLRIGMAHGEVWVTPSPIAGVAVWLSSTHPSISEEDRVAAG